MTYLGAPPLSQYYSESIYSGPGVLDTTAEVRGVDFEAGFVRILFKVRSSQSYNHTAFYDEAEQDFYDVETTYFNVDVPFTAFSQTEVVVGQAINSSSPTKEPDWSWTAPVAA